MAQSRGYKVRPLSKEKIRSLAENLRDIFDLRDGYLDIVRLYEGPLTEAGLIFDVCEADELGDNEGLTIPDQNVIRIRLDVYESARAGGGRGRFTMAHELGHLLLHDGISFARCNSLRDHKIYEDSEWQADTFAAELLMPFNLIKPYTNIKDIGKQFGVTPSAARIRKENLFGRI